MNKILKFTLTAAICLLAMQHIYAADNTIAWTPCQDAPDFQCGMLTVPIDYQNPQAGTIQLPVTIHYATGRKLGTLITNYGGPWVDEISVAHSMFNSFTPTVQNNYDVVSFSPRGVASNSISCHSDNINAVNEIQRELNLTYMNTTQGIEAMYDGTVQQRQLCTYDNLAKYASTKNTLQDMDALRQALGVTKIDYLGYSYGTRLGLAYLLQYPEHVNKMLLDSNMEPNNDYAQLVSNWSLVTENVLHAFFQFCAAAGPNECAMYQHTPDEIEVDYKNLVARAIAEGGIPTSATYNMRPFTAAMLSMTTTIFMGGPRYWQQFAEALNDADTQNNADALMSWYMQVSNYIPATNSYQYNNSATFSAVICKDYSIPAAYKNRSGWIQAMSKLSVQYPLEGGTAAAATGGSACIDWAESSEPLLPIAPARILNASPTVLLVGDLYDPRGPLSATQAVGAYLSKLNVTNKVLAWNGVGHMSYASSAPTGGCIDTNVDNFFATGQLPTTSVCNDQVNPFLNTYSEQDAAKTLRNLKGNL